LAKDGERLTGQGAYIELVDGALAAAAEDLGGRLEDPDDGSVIGPQRASESAVVERALAVAQDAWSTGAWSDLSLGERRLALERLATELDARAEDVALLDAVDSGVPISVTRAVAGSLGSLVCAVLDEAERAGERRGLAAGGRRVEVLRLPWGPAVLLTPWNAPAAAAVAKIANALAAGCPAILKPSELAPSSAGVIAEAALAAQLPPGALQIVHGGAAVAQHLAGDQRVRMVSLTGGAAAGRAVALAAAPRMAALQLELGGTNPAIVTSDADIPAAARSLAAGATKLNGQWCEAPRRVFVAAGRHDDLVDALEEALTQVHVGPARDARSEVGPLVSGAHRDRVVRQVEALGGEARATAAVPDGPGSFMSPTLVLGVPAGGVREEIFGPVLSVHRVAADVEAVGAANANGDGLAGYVFCGDDERAFALGRALHCGEIRIGGTNLLDLAPGSTQSFWGSSGIGAHGGREVLEAFRGSRIIGEEDPTLAL
jgi:betaine-aldehyde dehydrogenase